MIAMPAHPAFAPILSLAADIPDVATIEAPALRAIFDGWTVAVAGAEMAEVRDLDVPGPAGPIPARLFRPLTGDPHPPLLLWLHGGGWSVGSVDRSDATIRAVAEASGALTLAIDYRLAPEHPFPEGVDDSWAALQWLATHGAELGGDPERLAVAGDSAGANLAAVLCLIARLRGGPRIGCQALVYPVCGFDFDTPSYLANAEGFFLTRAMMQRFADWYIPHDRRDDWMAAPLAADDLAGLPPAIVITAEFDPLRDEGRAYAERLADAGVAVEHLDMPGMIHGFFAMPVLVPESAVRAQRSLGRAVRSAFG